MEEGVGSPQTDSEQGRAPNVRNGDGVSEGGRRDREEESGAEAAGVDGARE